MNSNATRSNQRKKVPKVSRNRGKNINQGDDFHENEPEDEPIEEEEYVECRYRFKDGRYYYDRRGTDEPGSIDVDLDYDSKWEPGFKCFNYMIERDRVLRDMARVIISEGHEKERLIIGKEKTFPVFLKGLPLYYDLNVPKPIYEKESINEKQGRIYLIRHKIIELFQNVTTLLVFHRPENPKEFIIGHLNALNAAREGYPSPYADDGEEDEDAATVDGDAKVPRVFTDDDVVSTFTLMEPCGCGKTIRKKYHHALESLGVDQIVAEDPQTEPAPPDATAYDVLDKEAFVTAARRGVITQARTFYPRRQPRIDPQPPIDITVFGKMETQVPPFDPDSPNYIIIGEEGPFPPAKPEEEPEDKDDKPDESEANEDKPEETVSNEEKPEETVSNEEKPESEVNGE